MSTFEEELLQDAEGGPGDTEVSDGDMKSYVEELAAINDELERYKAWKTAKEARKDELRKKLIPDMMHRLGVANALNKGTMTIAGVGRVSLRTDTYVSCPEGQKPALLQFLDEIGDGDIIRRDVHPQTLKAHVKELRERGDTDRIPTMLKIHDEVSAVLTRG